MNDATDTENMDLEEFSKGNGNPSDDNHNAVSLRSGNDDIQRSASDLEAVFDIPVRIQAILGRKNMEVSELLGLEKGDIVELDRKVGEAIDIFVNDRLVARGEVVLVDDRLGVTMTEIIKGEN